jgi:hypothetical protein
VIIGTGIVWEKPTGAEKESPELDGFKASTGIICCATWLRPGKRRAKQPVMHASEALASKKEMQPSTWSTFAWLGAYVASMMLMIGSFAGTSKGV